MRGSGFLNFSVPFWITIINVDYRPMTKEELFNLHHSSARNMIERIFGVLKRHFRILLTAPEYSLEIQAWIPAALCAIHNFIRTHDTDDTDDILTEPEFIDHASDDHDDASIAAAVEADRSSNRHDIIAQQMWDDYMRICSKRGINEDEEDDDEEDDEDDDDGEDQGEREYNDEDDDA